VLDGLGHRDEPSHNAVQLAQRPVLSWIAREHRCGLIDADGNDGLPERAMGNAEAAYVALGAGRPPRMNASRIDAAIEEGALAAHPAIGDVLGRAKDVGGRLHLIGLVSDGGVHSSTRHLFALIELAKSKRVRVIVHALLDGRDVPPLTAPRYVADLESRLAGGVGRIGTVSGRSWGMDRAGRWDRVQKCYRAILAAEVYRADSALRGIEQSYEAKKTDEFVEPFVVFDYPGVSPVDAAIHFNFRADRADELSRALAAPSFDAFPRKGGRAPFAGRFACMTTVDSSLGLPTLFPSTPCPNTLPEILARAGYRQFRCAETEGFAQVTQFFNAGREAPFEGEDRRLLPSPRDVPTYDLRPEMAAPAVAKAAVEAIGGGKYDFVLINFVNADAVAHTGNLDATIRAVEAVDKALGEVLEATRSARGALVVTAAYGNAEQMRDEATGEPHARHTGSQLPLYYMNDADIDARIRKGGRLCDVAPTLLDLLGLPPPEEMTGRSLLVR
jgi:2,3-bisphosphoglycerate-independent phosphoglycerate mutase